MNLAELDDRISKCNKILGENPNSQIFAALADAYRKKGKLDHAFRVCQNGLRVHPNYVSAHTVMARINLDKAMFDWAEIEVNKAITLEGNSFATDLLLAEINIRKGDFSKAVRILDKLEKLDPNNSQVKKFLELCERIPSESSQQIQPKSIQEPPPVSAEAITPNAKSTVDDKPFEEPNKNAPQKDNLEIDAFLDTIYKIPGLDGILLVNKEGLVAESRWPEDSAPDEFGAVVREIEATIQTQIGLTRFGTYENLLIEAKDLTICVIPLKNSMLLIKGNAKFNLGSLRLKMSALLEKLDKDFLK